MVTNHVDIMLGKAAREEHDFEHSSSWTSRSPTISAHRPVISPTISPVEPEELLSTARGSEAVFRVSAGVWGVVCA